MFKNDDFKIYQLIIKKYVIKNIHEAIKILNKNFYYKLKSR